jgi:hypothetical protein
MMTIDFPTILATIAKNNGEDLNIRPHDRHNAAIPKKFVMSSRGDDWSTD